MASIPASQLVGPVVVVDKTAEVRPRTGLSAHRRGSGRPRVRARPGPAGRWVLFRSVGIARPGRGLVPEPRPRGSEQPRPRRLRPEVAGRAPQHRRLRLRDGRYRRGSAGGMDPGFPVHNFLLGAGRYGLTQLANLTQLAEHRRADRRRPAETGRRHRQSLARARLRLALIAGGPWRASRARSPAPRQTVASCASSAWPFSSASAAERNSARREAAPPDPASDPAAVISLAKLSEP